MVAYIIYETTITDVSWREEYAVRVKPLLERHGGKVLARDNAPERVEGERKLPTVVIVMEFPDRASADAWRNDIEYEPLLKLRQSGSTAEAVLVDGL
jgi:uncharacterized protein (DUF1330 family)